MALARIITRFAPASRPLAENLRARGFEVQMRSPEETSSEPADLEITLDECATEEALKRAMRTPDNGVCVFIAPGTLIDSLGTVPTIPFAAEPGKDAPTLEPGLEPLLFVAGGDGEEGDAANDVELQPQTVDELPAMISGPAPFVHIEPHAVVTAERNLEMQQAALDGVLAMTSKPEHSPPAETQPVFPAIQPALAAATNGRRTQPETGRESHIVAPKLEPIMRQQPESVSVWPSQQLSAMAAGRKGVPGEVPPEAVLAQPPAGPLVMTQLAKRAARESARAYVAFCRRFLSRDKSFWTTATVAGMAAVAALLLVASARHLPPVPASRVPSSRESQQHVSSFKTKRNASTPLRRKAPATASSSATAAVKPAVAPNSSVANAGSVTASGVALASDKVKSKQQHRSAYGSEEDVVAKDTVIRYESRTAPPSPPARKQREIKHYSDMK